MYSVALVDCGRVFEETDLVTVLEAILTSRQPREQLACLYENLMSHNFRKTAVITIKFWGP